MRMTTTNTQIWICVAFLLGTVSILHASILPDLVLQGSFFSLPSGIAIDPTSNALYVADFNNNMVMRFNNRHTLVSNSSPSMVFGQPTLASIVANYPSGVLSAAGLNQPEGLWVDDAGSLWVADSGNWRVLWFANASTLMTNDPPATGVVGQPNFTSVNSNNITPNRIRMTVSARTLGSTLWVADEENNRVLWFNGATSNSFPKADASADGVIGQNTFSTDLGNTTNPGPGEFAFPVDVYPTSNGIVVTDILNNRALLFPPNPAIGADAISVYGQPSFSTTSSGPASAYSLNQPVGVAVGYEGTLFIADSSNSRILMYPPIDSASPTNNAAVDVIGQQDLNSATSGSPPGLHTPQFMAYDPSTNSLWVTDSGNQAVLRYPNIIVQPTTNISSSLSVQITFQGHTPKVLLQPKAGGVGGVTNQQNSLLLSPSSITEVTSDGAIVNAYLFPQLGYTASSYVDAQNNQHFQFVSSFPFKVRVDYILFAVNSTLESAGISFDVAPSTLKLSISLEGWNFTSPRNSLQVKLALNIKPAVISISQLAQNTTGNSTTFVLQSSTLTTTINLLHFGVLDNRTATPISFFLNDTTASASSTSPNSTLDLVLQLPHFNHSFSYDPDFSVSLAGGGGGATATLSGDGGSSDLLPLVALAALVIIPGLCLCLGGIMLGIVIVKRRRLRAKVSALADEQQPVRQRS